FARGSLAETLAAVLDREPDWGLLPVTTPRSMVRVMRRCLQKDPAKRLRDIGDAIDDLDEPELQADAHAPTSSRSGVSWFVPWAVAVMALTIAVYTATRSRR